MTETAGDKGTTEGGLCPCAPCQARVQKPLVRVGRWVVGHSDLTKPPAPLIRWAFLLILGLSCWAAELPLDIKDWLAPIIIAGALILPDVAGFGIAGVRLDLKQQQDELATLRQDVNAQARSNAVASNRTEVNVGVDNGLRTYGNVVGAEREPQAPYVPRRFDTGSAAEVRSQLWPISASPSPRKRR